MSDDAIGNAFFISAWHGDRMENWIVPALDQQACTGCGLCAARCPVQVVALRGGTIVFVHPESCTYCGECEAVCPTQAIALPYAIVWDDESA